MTRSSSSARPLSIAADIFESAVLPHERRALDVAGRTQRQRRALGRAVAAKTLGEIVVGLDSGGARELACGDAHAVANLAIRLDARDDLHAVGRASGVRRAAIESGSRSRARNDAGRASLRRIEEARVGR